jgi:hypothetical protein
MINDTIDSMNDTINYLEIAYQGAIEHTDKQSLKISKLERQNQAYKVVLKYVESKTVGRKSLRHIWLPVSEVLRLEIK